MTDSLTVSHCGKNVMWFLDKHFYVRKVNLQQVNFLSQNYVLSIILLMCIGTNIII